MTEARARARIERRLKLLAFGGGPVLLTSEEADALRPGWYERKLVMKWNTQPVEIDDTHLFSGNLE